MNPLTPDQVRAKRSEAQKIPVTLHVGKAGLTPAAVAELDAQLKARKLVKVRLLEAAREAGGAAGAGEGDLAQALADSTRSTLIERRGHTAVFYRP